ncbi:MAG: hypothetical protein A2Z35_04285 [Actinobacteria bacterium RBG_19FT_COMBO_36_27]|nr:MAG: hypothetical protein A2Z35_04285 [Actinobacteria bacterium RBG_19FT_COMBO_36_27]
MIICGTGSNCYGMNESGKEAKATGWDYILGDEGSGYEIGRKALKAIMKAYDGRGKETLLTKTILESLNIKDISHYIIWAYEGGYSKEKIASMAKTVCKTAKLSDDVSIKILEEEAQEAFVSVITVVKNLDLVDKNFDLVLVGKLFKCKRYFRDILNKKIRDKCNGVNIKPLTNKPVEGAIKIALDYL